MQPQVEKAKMIKISSRGFSVKIKEEDANPKYFEKVIESVSKLKNKEWVELGIDAQLGIAACVLKKEEFDKLYNGTKTKAEKKGVKIKEKDDYLVLGSSRTVERVEEPVKPMKKR